MKTTYISYSIYFNHGCGLAVALKKHLSLISVEKRPSFEVLVFKVNCNTFCLLQNCYLLSPKPKSSFSSDFSDFIYLLFLAMTKSCWLEILIFMWMSPLIVLLLNFLGICECFVLRFSDNNRDIYIIMLIIHIQ